MSYLEELAALLRERRVPEERIRSTVDDLASFTAEGGAGPEEEFGPVAEFADDLVGQGSFVSHRDGNPRAWEYRQERAPGRRERTRMAERLAPQGWEPCGHYLTHAYFKRARAALVGPEAEPSERTEPARRRFLWSAPGLAVTTFFLALLAVSSLSLAQTLRDAQSPDRVAALLGAGVGGALGLAGVIAVVWLLFRLVAWLRNR